jgi:prophage maintenance system killer protein
MACKRKHSSDFEHEVGVLSAIFLWPLTHPWDQKNGKKFICKFLAIARDIVEQIYRFAIFGKRKDWNEESPKESNVRSASNSRRKAEIGRARFDKESNQRNDPKAQKVMGQAEQNVEYYPSWPSWEDIDMISREAVLPHAGYKGKEGEGEILGAVGAVRSAYGYGHYRDIFDLVADLICKVQRKQTVAEGNKRTGIAVGFAFLERYGFETGQYTRDEPREDELIRLVNGLSDSIPSERTRPKELADFLRRFSGRKSV